jgi:nitronate monooxygenase
MTDPLASPTSFPLKVAQMPGTIADRDVYESRARVCDLGYLREAYRKPDGTVGFRCPAEPVHAFTGKGGAREATTGRKCICNALLATIGLGQRRGPHDEPPLVTCGDAINDVSVFMTNGRLDYSAADVVRYLLDGATMRPADRRGA